VDPAGGGRTRVVAVAGKLGRREEEAEEPDACEDDEEEPLQRGREGTRPS